MAQIIIVSNRLPVSVKKENGELIFYPSLGGLATGLSSYVDNPDSQWIGWPGIASDELTTQDRQYIAEHLAKQNCYPVFLNRRQIEDFYNGYSNKVLWPTFHNLPVRHYKSNTLKRWWQAYRQANNNFIQAVLSLANTNARVWIHDYQLMLAPEILRSKRKDINIGFFLHTPFPKAKTFSRLAEQKKLINGILGADLVGFHTPDYVANFLEICQTLDINMISDHELFIENHAVRVADFPMGIDYEKYSSSIKSPLVKQALRRYRQRYKKLRVIVSVDRLDPTKGLIERLDAYGLLLERRPDLRGKVVFTMVAAPSRINIKAYQNLALRVEKLVKNINRKYRTPDWKPIDYINVSQPFEEVTALFQVADVAFIAPLRDGMNLAAKEFVASKHKSGVLILSETAGAAVELKDAIIVNPKRLEELVEALEQAMSMSRRELRLRMRRMQHQLSTNTVQQWAKTFVNTLQQPINIPGKRLLVKTMRGQLLSGLLNDWNRSKKHLLLLDYDGSLVPFTENYKHADPSKSLLQLLRKLSEDPRNDLLVISGRSASDLEKWFGNLPITLIAEHGATFKKAGHQKWQVIEPIDNIWKQLLLPVLEKYAALAPGAKVEVKPHSLVWHYRGVSPYQAQKYAVIIRRTLRPTLKKYELELLQGNKVLEIKNPRISKGVVIEGWLKRNYPFILALGDDITDEDVFAVLPPGSYSIKVGRGRTHAHYRLASPNEVIKLLRKLT